MKVSYRILYSETHAWVDSMFVFRDKNIIQTHNSYKSAAILQFVFVGKSIRIENGCFTVDCDKLDVEFLRIAANIPARKTGIWSKVYKMLVAGKSREEVLKWLAVRAIAEQLQKGR